MLYQRVRKRDEMMDVGGKVGGGMTIIFDTVARQQGGERSVSIIVKLTAVAAGYVMIKRHVPIKRTDLVNISYVPWPSLEPGC